MARGGADAAVPAAADAADRADADLLGPARARPARRSATCAGPDGRPGSCAGSGRSRRTAGSSLDGRSSGPAPGRGTSAGSASSTPGGRSLTRSPPGSRPAGRRSGRARSRSSRSSPRHRPASCRRPISPRRHGPSAAAGLVRRGLAEADVRERPRRPLAARPPGRRGGRPAASDLAARPGRGGRPGRGRDRRRATRARSCSTA